MDAKEKADFDWWEMQLIALGEQEREEWEMKKEAQRRAEEHHLTLHANRSLLQRWMTGMCAVGAILGGCSLAWMGLCWFVNAGQRGSFLP